MLSTTLIDDMYIPLPRYVVKERHRKSYQKQNPHHELCHVGERIAMDDV